MSFFSFTKSEEEVSILIDIGSGNVTLSLAIFSRKAPYFIYSIKNSFPLDEKTDHVKFISSLGTILDEQLTNAIKFAFNPEKAGLEIKKISRVLVSFASPWHIFKSHEVHLSEKKPFTITKSFLDDVSAREEKNFKKELTSEHSELGKHSWKIIERSIVHTRLNGYILENSVGKKTSSLDVFMYLSAIPEYVEKKVTEKIMKHTHIRREEIMLHTFPLISFLSVRNNLAKNSDFLLLDVAGEVSELSMIKSDTLSQSAPLPMGRNFILRQIVKHSKVSVEIAESLLKVYLSRKTNDKTTHTIQKILLDIEKEWFIYFQDALHSFSPVGAYPRKIFMTVDKDVAPIFVEYLKTFKMEVTLVNEETLSNLFRKDPKIVVDEFGILLADFYNTIKNS